MRPVGGLGSLNKVLEGEWCLLHLRSANPIRAITTVKHPSDVNAMPNGVLILDMAPFIICPGVFVSVGAMDVVVVVVLDVIGTEGEGEMGGGDVGSGDGEMTVTGSTVEVTSHVVSASVVVDLVVDLGGFGDDRRRVDMGIASLAVSLDVVGSVVGNEPVGRGNEPEISVVIQVA